MIMNELEDFYTGLYDSEDNLPDCADLSLRHSEIPKLSPEKAATCEGKLTVEECLQSLQSFKENKSPGNDGLTVEFYKTFWRILGELLLSRKLQLCLRPWRVIEFTKASDYNAYRKERKRQETNFKLETNFTYKFRHKDRIKSNCKETSRGDTRYSTS